MTDQQISPSFAAAYRIVVKAGLRRRRRLGLLEETADELRVFEAYDPPAVSAPASKDAQQTRRITE